MISRWAGSHSPSSRPYCSKAVALAPSFEMLSERTGSEDPLHRQGSFSGEIISRKKRMVQLSEGMLKAGDIWASSLMSLFNTGAEAKPRFLKSPNTWRPLAGSQHKVDASATGVIIIISLANQAVIEKLIV